MEVHYESLTVVETNVHYPTDVSLLWDALRCLLRVLPAACLECGVTGWRQSSACARRGSARSARGGAR